jgi:hypothetical protein
MPVLADEKVATEASKGVLKIIMSHSTVLTTFPVRKAIWNAHILGHVVLIDIS